MVTVPRRVLPDTQAQDVGIPEYGISRADAAALKQISEGSARDLARLGRGIKSAGDELFKIGIEQAKRENERRVQEAETDANEFYRQQLFSPKTGALKVKLGDAKGLTKKVGDAFKEYGAKVESGFQSEHEKALWRDFWHRRSEQALNQASRHEMTQTYSAQQRAKAAAAAAAARAYMDSQKEKHSLDKGGQPAAASQSKTMERPAAASKPKLYEKVRIKGKWYRREVE